MWGCERMKLLLIGHEFLLLTDNRAIKIFLRNPRSKPPARIERWGLRLSDFRFQVEHSLASIISRIICRATQFMALRKMNTPKNMSHSYLITLYQGNVKFSKKSKEQKKHFQSVFLKLFLIYKEILRAGKTSL